MRDLAEFSCRGELVAMKSSPQKIVEPCGLGFAQLERLSDEDLMAHLQAGHDDALAVLFERYRRLILAVALKILRDPGEAQDQAQEIFLEVRQVAGQFDPARGSTKIWLLQFAFHRSLNRRKYLERRKFYDQNDGLLSELSEPFTLPSGAGLFALPEVRSLVRQGLDNLNVAQRQTLEMTYFEGMTLREIADRTGESLGNVRHHYYRGLSRLRSVLLGAKRSRKGDANQALVRGGISDVGT